MADEDLSLTEDQLLDTLDESTLNEEDTGMQIDPELEAIKLRVKEMEEGGLEYDETETTGSG